MSIRCFNLINKSKHSIINNIIKSNSFTASIIKTNNATNIFCNRKLIYPLATFSTNIGNVNTSNTTNPNTNNINTTATSISMGVANSQFRVTGPPSTNPHLINAKDTVEQRRNISSPSLDTGDNYLLPHPIWKGEYVNQVKPTHRPTQSLVDDLAYWTIRTIRFNFDWMSGYMFQKPNEKTAATRVIFLETIAGVPGSIAGIVRHLTSLRRMQRDGGWIHTLFEEAENERMHLLTFIQIANPGPIMRTAVFISQGIFFNFFWVMYLLSPRFCHRLVGYLEEEAVKTYTKMIEDYDAGYYPNWAKMPVPEIARKYWSMDEKASMRDLLCMIRADEGHHRDVNHCFADLKSGELNPFKPGH